MSGDAEHTAENDAALLLAYTRWLFDKQDITRGRFDYLPEKFLADTGRVIPPGSGDQA